MVILCINMMFHCPGTQCSHMECNENGVDGWDAWKQNLEADEWQNK